MTIPSNALTTEEVVIIGLTATRKGEAIRQLADRMKAAGRVTSVEGFLDDVKQTEEQMTTGLPDGIAIPHARSEHVVQETVAVGLCDQGVDFGAPDGPSHLIFLIGAPAGSEGAHLQILTALARKVVREDFRQSLRSATTTQEVADIMSRDIPA